MPGPLVIAVLDGFGLAPGGTGNAVSLARTPTFDRLYAECPWCPLEASGLDVGLPAGIMGNSEVGHLNLGAGRIVPQDIVRIDQSIASGSFFDNEVFRGAVESATRRGGRLHLMGLLSRGNVHSAQPHADALVDLAARSLPPERILLHLFTDGRDTPPRSADGFVAEFRDHVAGRATFATLSGRYFAMDRDTRWERTERAYAAVARGEGLSAPDVLSAIQAAYERGEGDEFIQPTVLETGRAVGLGIRDGDSGVFWNYRADRARQLCSALTEPELGGFERGERPRGDAAFELASMTQYDARQRFPAAFAPEGLRHLLTESWADAGMRQLRIAETEKYAHVTYFFNGGNERVLDGEERILVPSPQVATYDLQPEMSAPPVTDRLVGALGDDRFDAVVLNLANADMVGHTGDIPATVKAVEVLDRCIGRIADVVAAKGGVLLVTADHGNAEKMIDPDTGTVHTAHTTNPVPLIVMGAPVGAAIASGGRLCDVAPTALTLSRMEQPEAMTGRSLIQLP